MGLWKGDLELWTGLEWLRKNSSKTCVQWSLGMHKRPGMPYVAV